MNNPQLSVIICTYNRSDCILDALHSLVQQTLPRNLFEVLLVNNNSADDTASLCENFAQDIPGFNYRYLLETQQGLSHARNRGIREAAGDVIIFIDDDAIAESDYLERMSAFFMHTPDAAACGGRIYPRFESRRPRWMSHFLLPLTSSIDWGNSIKIFHNRQFPIGANMAVRSSMFKKYGLFNPGLGRKGNNLDGGEEKDFFYRLASAGEKIYYVPDAIVHHYVPSRRLTFDFFRRQSIGIGKSERIRAKSLSPTEYFKSLLREGLKWGASTVLFIFYFLTLRPAKAFRLLAFRWYVSKGLFSVNRCREA
ncbi:MAG: glycosyltransferase [Prevotellaceae bacterium]|jgi:glycosyltransferase involved in cell wall biosynthesis|nr:glycosyltransferase [Prevotellaceae bacterium]